ncbi:hypothetical protein NMG60_11023539 [Bertholletia excelsa]
MSRSNTSPYGSFLHDLKKIWDEIGESDFERDRTILQLEEECLDICRSKVEKARKYKAELLKSLAETEAEITNLISALGESASIPQYQNENSSLKERISARKNVLEDLQLKKQKRLKEFMETKQLIGQISAEIAGNDQFTNSAEVLVDERILTAKKLGVLQSQLQELRLEKALRLQRVDSHAETIQALSLVMSLDFNKTIQEAHPSLGSSTNGESKSISNDTLARLTELVRSLKQEKQQRLRKLQDLGNTLIELWNIMETSTEEQKKFEQVTCLLCSSVDEISKQGCLALDVIKLAEVEVERINVQKTSKMKELAFKRQTELEEIYREVHMDVDSVTARQILINLMDSGNIDLSDLLFRMDDQIAKAKDLALSRKDILDKVEKWKHASEEENWLDEYERDENRYCGGRGAHKNLKRAEMARILISKIPSLVDSLTTKVKAWENENGVPFLYNKASLLHMLGEYITQRQQKEEEKRRSREQKRLQEQIALEQEALYGSKPSVKKGFVSQTSSSGNKNSNVVRKGTPTGIGRRMETPSGRYGVPSSGDRKERGESGNVTVPLNYVAIPKEDPNSTSQGS